MPHQLSDAALGAIGARLTVDAGELMHALHGERGLSVMHVLSGEGRYPPLDHAWVGTDTAVSRLLTTLGRSHTVVPQSALAPFTEMRLLLEVRRSLRAAVRDRQTPAHEVVARYSAMIGQLLAGLDECATLPTRPALGKHFDAHRALMHAEEEGALARVYGMLMLAGLVPEDTPVLPRLLAAQQLHLAEFAAGALPEVRTALIHRSAKPPFQRAEQLERLAAAGTRRITTDEWYGGLTPKLRALREVDDLDATLLLEHASHAA